MINSSVTIFLASKSPRRRKLLKQIGVKFNVLAVDVDENPFRDESPVHYVKRIAAEKMDKAVLKIKKGIIITADTTVVLNNEIIGKPSDKNEAVKFLTMLSGKIHFVYTGFQILNSENGKKIIAYEKTKVEFRELDRSEIIQYADSGSPLDKAGAYGIQDDFGAVFVKKITGCYYNVVGLPLPKVYENLKRVL